MKKLDLSYMGPVFKQARLDANMTQDELAERVGITSRFLQAIESNERGVSLDTLIRIIRALGISADTCRKKKNEKELYIFLTDIQTQIILNIKYPNLDVWRGGCLYGR